MKRCPTCGGSLDTEVVMTSESLRIMNKQAARIDMMQREIDRLIGLLATAEHQIEILEEEAASRER